MVSNQGQSDTPQKTERSTDQSSTVSNETTRPGNTRRDLIGLGAALAAGALASTVTSKTAEAAQTSTVGTAVVEQNVDANGFIRVHEQGTASVQVVNPAAAPVRTAGYPWEGRNPSWVQGWFDTGSIGPHGETGRYSYTVPSGRRAAILTGWAHWERRSVAATPGPISLEVGIYSPTGLQGAPGGAMFQIICTSNDNTLGQVKDDHLHALVVVPASVIVFVNTYDASAGGTCCYKAHLLIVEFDV